MNILLATASDQVWSRRLRAELEILARKDKFGQHALADDSRTADVILFVDPHQHLSDWTMRAFRTHPLVRQYPEKIFVYDERDAPRDFFPGVYVSMPRHSFDRRRHRAFGYYHLKNDTRRVVNAFPDLLFSFQGRRIGGVRNAVLALEHPRALLEDTSGLDFFAFDDSALSDVKAHYREVLGRSKFVLCPRGTATSSFRLFEALACGRVPVVLSDGWMEPEGIDWESCSVRIPETDAMAVARRLEDLEPDWPRMSAAARRVYEDWFAPEVWFHRVIEQCRDLLDSGAVDRSRPWLKGVVWRDGARHWKHALLRPKG